MARKMTSREYCHDCKKYSNWKFEDREGNQIIECPLCGHLHYRVVEGAYVDFSIEFRGERIDNMNRVREILELFPETRPELEAMFAVLEFGALEDAMRLQPSAKRWGQDSRQNQSWTITTSTIASWNLYSSANSSNSSNSTYMLTGYYTSST